MPTPSSNPPPDQTSPPPYSFSTCPEDQPHSSRSTRQAQDATRPTSDMESSQSSSSIASLTAAYTSEPSRDDLATAVSALIDGQASAGASPDTAASPRPLSSGTLATSPMSSGRDDDLKHQGADTSDRLSRESSTLSANLQVENLASYRREPDSLDWLEQEDEYDSPPMPADCTYLRVSASSIWCMQLAHTVYRKSPSHHHHSSDRAAGSAAHNSPRDKSTRSKSRSSTLTCASRFSAAICASKVCRLESAGTFFFLQALRHS